MVSKKRGADGARAEVEDLLARADDKRWRGGARCTTCTHEHAEAINSAVLTLLEKRASGETFYPWATFVREHLKPRYGLKASAASVKRHLEVCLGRKVV